MKLILLLSFVATFAANQLSAQCNDNIVSRCKKTIGSDALMLGAYNISFTGTAKPVEYKIGLKKDTKYRFAIDYDSEDEIPVMQVQLGGTALVSSFQNGKHYKSIEFVCTETHGYTLSLEGKKGCMILIISAVK